MTLPVNVIDKILTKLPVNDAVKTSVLSREWRDKWTSLSRLVFHSLDPFRTEDARGEECRRLEITIYSILLRHSFAIDEFELYTDLCPNFSHIDQWMLILRDRAIKDLSLRFYNRKCYKLHSCLFFFHLTILKLHNCIFQPPPIFKGFKNLKFISLVRVTIHNDVLNSLILHSDQLKCVHLSSLVGINLLKIHSPNLIYLLLQDAFDDICFTKSPVLYMVFIDSSGFPDQHLKRTGRHNLNVVSFLGCLPALKKLTLRGSSLEDFTTSSTIPHRIPLMINHLEYLGLESINFTVDEISAAVSILRSSPNLKALYLSINKYASDDTTSVDKFLKAPDLRGCCFSQLQRVAMRLFCPAMELIKFILAHSPRLESMYIGYAADKSTLSNVSKELSSFERASPQASLRITPI